jgi:hypothetical protein
VKPDVVEVMTAPAAAVEPLVESQAQVGNAGSEAVVEDASEVRQTERVIKDTALLVGDGETVVTEGYESSPGEFVFSSLKPTLKTLTDGSTVVELEAKGFKINVSGEVDAEFEEKSKRTMEVSSGGTVTMVTMTDDGVHNLSATVNLDELPLIRLQATGTKTGPSPGPPFLNGNP